MTFQYQVVILLRGAEPSLYRLVIGHAFRIAALYDAHDFLRDGEFLLLHDLEVADHIDSCIRSDECQSVQLLILEELVGNLDDSLLAMYFAGEVDTYGDLVLYFLQVKDVQCLIYVFSGYMVQYGTILQSAYY